MDTVGVYFQRDDYASFWLRLLVPVSYLNLFNL
jgi:hypothetical protein